MWVNNYWKIEAYNSSHSKSHHQEKIYIYIVYTQYYYKYSIIW